MKPRILDISDCSDSPLLGSSKGRRRWGRRSYTDLYKVRRVLYTKSRSTPNLSGLTEAYFKGTNGASMQRPQVDHFEHSPKVQVADISYQAHCAERWWAEFCRWFGRQKA